MSVMMKGLTLTQREQGSLQTLNLVLEGKMGVREAAYVLGLRHCKQISYTFNEAVGRIE